MKLNRLNFFLLLAAFIFTNFACAEFSFAQSERSATKIPPTTTTARFRVEVVASNLEVPWAFAFAPNNRLLFTERPGRLRVIENGKLRAAPLATIAEVEPTGESGLMGIALHPDFARNHLLYLAYAYRGDGKAVRVVRFREIGDALVEPKTIVENIPAARFHAGTRLRFGADNKLYITTGDATNQSQAQNLRVLGGKTLRLNDDGTIPVDNPFVNNSGARPEIWSYGHRNAQGMDWQPDSGLMFQTEHGPSLIDGVSIFKRSGGDEVNIVETGKNYGWAKISHDISDSAMESPIVYFSPAIAPASLMFYRGAAFPELNNNLFFGALKGECIVRLMLDGRRVVAQERLLEKQFGRIREIAEAPDGSIYFSTSNRDGRGEPGAEDDRILRLVPIKN